MRNKEEIKKEKKECIEKLKELLPDVEDVEAFALSPDAYFVTQKYKPEVRFICGMYQGLTDSEKDL